MLASITFGVCHASTARTNREAVRVDPAVGLLEPRHHAFDLVNIWKGCIKAFFPHECENCIRCGLWVPGTRE